MKLKFEASEAQMVPCYKAGTIALEVDMSKPQILLMLDEMAKQVKPQELVLMLDSVLEGVGVERVKPYQVRMANGTEMTIPAESSCLAMVQAQDQTGQFASSAKPAPADGYTKGALRVGERKTTLVSDAKGLGVPGSDDPAYGGFMVAESVHPENARRLAACWNACDGISTEMLESEASNVREWLDNKRVEAIDMAERNLDLKWQRNELLAVLQRLVPVNDIKAAPEAYAQEWHEALAVINKVKATGATP